VTDADALRFEQELLPSGTQSAVAIVASRVVRIASTRQFSHQKYLRRSIPLYMLATWSP